MFSSATTICEARAAAVRFSLGFETGGKDFNSRSTGATGWCSGLMLPSSTAVVELDTEITLFVMDSISLNQTIDTIANDAVDGMPGFDSTSNKDKSISSSSLASCDLCFFIVNLFTAIFASSPLTSSLLSLLLHLPSWFLRIVRRLPPSSLSFAVIFLAHSVLVATPIRQRNSNSNVA
nr:hypothetical protein Iba_chr11bCG11320 [Ipomoea batatas]